MRNLLAGALVAAALVLPVAPASASTANPPRAGVKECPPGYIGYVVWAWNEKRGYYDVISYCIPYGP